MTAAIDIKPLTNEFPSHFADRVGQLYAKTVTTQHKKDNGQFFTPTEIAHFMAGLTKQSKDKFKILDPGCGTAILSSSLIDPRLAVDIAADSAFALLCSRWQVGFRVGCRCGRRLRRSGSGPCGARSRLTAFDGWTAPEPASTGAVFFSAPRILARRPCGKTPFPYRRP